jgi:hypothetical protein
MISKYKIAYSVEFKRHAHDEHYLTNDPVAAQEFLVELLERGFKVGAIYHDGVPLSEHDADKMLKTAGELLARAHICRSLGIDSAEAKHRFGLPA